MGTPSQTDATSVAEPVTETNKQPEVDYEKRFKDTQAAYTKSRQELKEVKAKLEALEKLTTPRVEIPDEVKEELDTLKFEDPDKWRIRMNQLEQEAAQKHKAALDEAAQAVRQQEELARRAQVLQEFQASHPDITITDEVIQYDVPPRITRKLEEGKVSFEEFLEEVADYLKAPKKIGGTSDTLDQPDLGRVAGDNKPSEIAETKDIIQSYRDEIY